MKKIILSIALAVLLVASLILPACTVFTQPPERDDQPTEQSPEELPSFVQDLDYTESTQKIDNPDQGFYHPIYVKLTPGGATYAKYVVTNSTRLYHLRIDISEFSSAVNGGEDMLLTEEALKGFDELLSFLKSNDKNAIVRFAYDSGFNGAANKEPSLQTMLGHIEQVCPIINAYENTVTAVEVGMVGPWGEMHTSTVATAENIVKLTEAFLSNTDSTPVLVRTPKMIYNYLGISINDIDGYAVSEDNRLGFFNDGYLGSSTDLGTYTDRAREVEFLSKITAGLPYGGEVVTPSSTLHDIDKCLPEMFEMNLSYLNAEWNDQVVKKWKESYYTAECGSDEAYYGATAFEYIQNRMGYRLVLLNSTFRYAPAAEEVQIELALKNAGFGNLNRKKSAKLILTDESGIVVFSRDAGQFFGNEFKATLKPDLDSGEYTAYLCVYGEEVDGAPLYCLQFANDGLWNAELKANKIGVIIIEK